MTQKKHDSCVLDVLSLLRYMEGGLPKKIVGFYGREEAEAWGGIVSWSIRLDVRFLVTAGIDPKGNSRLGVQVVYFDMKQKFNKKIGNSKIDSERTLKPAY